MAVLSSSARDSLPDSAFAYIEKGGQKDASGRTAPRSLRHYPVHDAAHVRAALSRAHQGNRFAKEAMPKILSAAKTHGVEHEEAASTGRSFDSLYPEVRFLSDVPEIRSVSDGPAHIYGYAAAFSKLSRRLGGFVERVMPGAFDATLRSIAEKDVNVNLVCRFNHKDDMLLGTTQAGTLVLDVDERGLKYDVIPPNCRSDVLEYVQRGDVRYSSFAFRCVNPGEDDTWGVTDYGFPMRSLHKVDALDVAPVTDPAYRDTSAMARNMTGAVESLAMWVDAEPVEVRSMLEAGQAVRFFKRSDRPSPVPVPDVPAVSEERVMLDDPAVALRNWKYVADPADEAAEAAEPAAGERAMNAHGQMCKQYTHGEPCVLKAGHDGDHAQRCHMGQHGEHGLPCAKPSGHDGEHAPMAVDDGDEDDPPKRGPGRPRKRDAGDADEGQAAETRDEGQAAETRDEGGQDPGKRTMSAVEALAESARLRLSLTPID
jgi:hypothetical protein